MVCQYPIRIVPPHCTAGSISCRKLAASKSEAAIGLCSAEVPDPTGRDRMKADLSAPLSLGSILNCRYERLNESHQDENQPQREHDQARKRGIRCRFRVSE